MSEHSLAMSEQNEDVISLTLMQSTSRSQPTSEAADRSPVSGPSGSEATASAPTLPTAVKTWRVQREELFAG